MNANKKGFNIVEITLVAGMIIILTCAVILIVKPNEYKAKARDTKRIQDISKIYEALHEYKLKYGVYPGNLDQVYRSDVGFSSNLTNSANGWIDSDLSEFLQSQYIDPINTGNLIFKYQQNGTDFELNCLLEIKTDTMKNDKGDNINLFEIGTDLEILH